MVDVDHRLNPDRLSRWVLGDDRLVDLMAILGLLATFVALDRLTQAMVTLSAEDLESRWLTAAVFDGQRWLWLVMIAAGLIALTVRTSAMAASWSVLEYGSALRWLTAPVIVLVAWHGSLYPYNFVAAQSHWLDRLLIMALAAAAVWRPAFLVPLVLQFRIITEQTLFPFSTAATKNILELPTIALLIVAAVHLRYVVSGRRDTAPVLLLIAAAVAAHFYIPGKGKLLMGWLGGDDISNLPLAAGTAGWLNRSGPSDLSLTLASVFDSVGLPVKLATLGFELGGVVAVSHRRLLRWWLAGCLVFHAVTLAVTGFFFLSWVVVELGLLIVLSAPRLSSWSKPNLTPARGAIAVAATLASPVLFHPPGLAWFDAPVSYGYRVDVVGVSGRNYHVPMSTFGPLDHEMMFSRLQLTPTVALSGAYGAVDSTDQIEKLLSIDTIEALEAMEDEQAPSTLRKESEEFLLAYFDRCNGQVPGAGLRLLHPPSLFMSHAPEPNYHFQEPVAELTVELVTAIHDKPELTRRQRVLVIERGDGGAGQVVVRE